MESKKQKCKLNIFEIGKINLREEEHKKLIDKWVMYSCFFFSDIGIKRILVKKSNATLEPH